MTGCIDKFYMIECFRYLDAFERMIRNARALKHVSLGCVSDLIDHAEEWLPLLAAFQSDSLQELHLASVKENPESYGLIDLPLSHVHSFSNLQTLSVDYDYLSVELLSGFMHDCAALQRLVIHIHGVEPLHEKIPNHTWQRLVKKTPQLQVTLNLLHSVDGCQALLDILQPALPLTHLRLFFCEQLNTAALDFVSQHYCDSLQSVHIIEGINLHFGPAPYEVATEENPFVMLAWKCNNLQHFTFTG